MQLKRPVIGGLAVSLAAIMWGFDGIVLTPRLFNLDVVFVVFVLHAIPFFLMNVFLYKDYKHLKSFTRQDILFFTLVALTGGVIGTASIVKALFLVDFQELSVVVLLQKLQPIFSILLAFIILKEKLKARFSLWASVAIISSYFLVFGFSLPHLGSGRNIIYAALYSLLAAFAFGSSTVFSKKILQKYSFKTSTFYRYGISTIILFTIVLITGKFTQINIVTPENWGYFVLIALTTGSGAIFLYYFGLTRINAMTATMCELFFPISAILFDYFINGKVLSPIQWISASIMIFSIIKLNLLKNNHIKKG
ncbi:DMT family transporter [Desulfosarcina sp.]|nr:DMT family transporter [Desulfosarcina sp.]